jgi:hypothetical protein
MAPYYAFGAFGEEFSLIVAFVIGLGFGFFLERAGFGSARKLAAQFYFRDLAVLKVMFTAIITAMVGLYVLGRVGVLDLSLVYLTPTYLVPQIVGGLLLGIGFVIGGYCPGTSVVSAATGRIDGMVYVLGMIAGLFAYGELSPLFAPYTKLTAMGSTTLAAYFGVPYGVLVLAVVIMALAAFAAAEWAEGRIGGQKLTSASLTVPVRRLNGVRLLGAALVALGLGAAVSGDPSAVSRATIDPRALALEVGNKADHVSVEELASWIIAGRGDYRLLDVRYPEEFATYHIPGAENVPLAALSWDLMPRNETVVLCSEGGIHAAQAWFLLKSMGFQHVYLLLGGIEEWKDIVLFPRNPGENADSEARARFDRLAGMSRFFGGAPRGGDADAAEDLPTISAPILPTVPVAPPAGSRPKRQGC